MNAGLVGEGTEARDRVVERNVDLHCLSDVVLNLQKTSAAGLVHPGQVSTNFLQLLQLILASDVLAAADDHAGQETTEGLS